MVMDFDTFLTSLLGPSQRSNSFPMLTPQPAMMQTQPSPPIQGPVIQAPSAPTQPPIQQGGSNAFAALERMVGQMQAPPVQGAVLSPPQPQPTGAPQGQEQPAETQTTTTRTSDAYYLIEYQAQDPVEAAKGPQVFMLPVERGELLPDGARIMSEPISDPVKLQRAEDAGHLYEQQSDTIRVAFRTSEELYQTSQQREAQQNLVPEAVDVNGNPLKPGQLSDPGGTNTFEFQRVLTEYPGKTTDEIRATDPTGADFLESHGITEVPAGMVPRVNGQGKVEMVYAVNWEQTEAEKTPEGKASATVATAIDTITNPMKQPRDVSVLTTRQLRQTDEAKANRLEAAGIFEIGVDEMVVSAPDGTVSLVPYQAGQEPPEGYEVVTYGGAPERPDKPVVAGAWDIVGGVADAVASPIDTAKAVGGALWDVADPILNVPLEWSQETVTGIILNAPETISSLTTAYNLAKPDMPDVVQTVMENFVEPVFESPAWGRMAQEIQENGLMLIPLNPINANPISGGGIAAPTGPGIARVERTGIAPIDLAYWTSTNEEIVADVMANGYDANGDGQADFTGERAVWERFQEDNPTWLRAVYDVQLDPYTWATGGASGARRGAARVLGQADEVPLWRWVAGGGLQKTANILNIPDHLLDRYVLGGIGKIFRGGGSVVKNIPVVKSLIDFTDRTVIDAGVRPIASTVNDILARMRETPGDVPPTASTPGDIDPRTPGGPQTAPVDPDVATTTGTAPPIPPSAVAPPTQANLTVNGQTTVSGTDPISIVTDALQPPRTVADVPTGPAQMPFDDTALARPVADLQKPDWDFLTPVGREEVEQTPRLIDAVWDARAQYPDRWEAFAREYEPQAQRFRQNNERLKTGRVADEQETGNGLAAYKSKVALQAVHESQHVINDLLPAIERHFGDVMPLPTYRPRYDVPNPKTNQMEAVLIERAIFNPDQAVADQAFDEIKRRAFKVDANGEIEKTVKGAQMVRDSSLADVYTKVEGWRERYRPYRERAAARQDIPTQAALETPRPPAATQAPPAESPASPALQVQGATTPLEGMQPAPGYYRTDPDTVRTDPDRFQPREELNDARVNRMAQNFSREAQDPVRVWRDPSDGETYVLSGHHRLEAARRAKTLGNPDAQTLEVRVFEGSEQQARQIANSGNIGAALQKPMENYRSYKNLIEQGMSPDEARSQFNISGTNYVNQLEQASNLNPRMQKLLDDSYDEFGNLQRDVGSSGLNVQKASRLGRSISTGKYMDAGTAESWYMNNAYGKTMSDTEFSGRIGALEDWIDLKREGLAVKGQPQAQLWDADDVATDVFAVAQDEIYEQRKAIRKLVTERNRLVNANAVYTRRGETPPRANARLAKTIDAEIEDITQGIEDVVSRAVPEPAPVTPANDLLRPMTEADARAARPTTPAPQSMDLGDAARPQFAARAQEGGVADANDLLQQPERSAADMMRDSGSQSLFAVNQPRPLGDMLRGLRTDARTVGEQTVNRPMANPLASQRRNEDVARRERSFGAETGRPEISTFRSTIIGEEEHIALARNFTDASGAAIDTVAQRWNRYIDELLEAGMDAESAVSDAGKRVVDDWAVQSLKIRPGRHEKYQQAYERLTTRAKNPVDPAAAQTRAFAEAISDDKSLWRFYETPLAILREMTLYNPVSGFRYIMTQMVGNAITLMLTGNSDVVFSALSPANVRAAFNDLGEYPSDLIKSSDQQAYEALGIMDRNIDAVVKDESSRGGVDLNKGLNLHQATDRIFRLGRTKLPEGKTRGGPRASSLLASKNMRDFANSFDLSARRALNEHMVRTNAAIARRDFQGWALERLPANVSEQQFTEAWETLPDLFSSADVRTIFRQLGDDRFADRMARDWQNAVSTIKKDAQAETNRAFFSGDERNADKVLRRIVFFHYWASRAFPLYTSSLMKNVPLLNAYIRMTEHLADNAEEYGPAAAGFAKLMSTPMGYNIFLRPDAMLQVYGSFWDSGGYSPDGENRFGAFMRGLPVMVNPLLGTVVNLSGSMGDTFAPDPLMLGQLNRLVEDSVNYARAQGWMGDDNQTPVRIQYNEVLNEFRSGATDVLEEVIPGIDHIPYRDSAVYAVRELNTLIQDVAEERGYERNGIEAQTAMGNADSPLYQEAFRRMADQGMLDHALRVTPLSVFYPKSRPASADERNLAITALPEGEERDALMDERAMANIVDEDSRALNMAADEYYGIGTEEERAAYQTYNAIGFGNVTEPITVGGQEATPQQLRDTDDDTRWLWAEAWAEENGHTGAIQMIKDERTALIEQNPDWAGYQEWAKTVRDHPGGALAWWRMTAAGNPNAERYLETALNEYEGPVKDIDWMLTNQESYMNVMGIQPRYSDPSPISTNNGQAQPFVASGSPQESGPSWGDGAWQEPSEESITESLNEYDRKRAEYNLIVSGIFEQEVDIDQLNPMARQAVVSNIYRDYGISVPELGGHGADYIRWAEQNQEGDMSVAAYLEWRRTSLGGISGAGLLSLAPGSADKPLLKPGLFWWDDRPVNTLPYAPSAPPTGRLPYAPGAPP